MTLGLLFVVLVMGVVVAGANYLALGKNRVAPGEKQAVKSGITISDDKPVEYLVEEVARGLFVPWDIEFTGPNRFLVTERDGKIRGVDGGKLIEEPLLKLAEVTAENEAGLMGMALDPNYIVNRKVYVCLAHRSGSGLVDQVLALVDRGENMERLGVAIDNIPSANFHAGCRIAFGPDRKLYVTTGDGGQKNLAQDVKSLAGKILRINSDGSIPGDNPLLDSPVYSYGHRNPQGMAWLTNGTMWETEHGPSGFDGPGGGDEVNLIEPGKNYGWPVVSHKESAPGMIDPILEFTPAEAPAALLVYSGKVFPQFRGNLLFGALKGEGIFRVKLDETGKRVEFFEKLAGLEVGRIREVVEGPEGYIYFTTSNRDGRGRLRDGEDKVYRLVPKE